MPSISFSRTVRDVRSATAAFRIVSRSGLTDRLSEDDWVMMGTRLLAGGFLNAYVHTVFKLGLHQPSKEVLGWMAAADKSDPAVRANLESIAETRKFPRVLREEAERILNRN